jgi:hypothetical protein
MLVSWKPSDVLEERVAFNFMLVSTCFLYDLEDDGDIHSSEASVGGLSGIASQKIEFLEWLIIYINSDRRNWKNPQASTAETFPKLS